MKQLTQKELDLLLEKVKMEERNRCRDVCYEMAQRAYTREYDSYSKSEIALMCGNAINKQTVIDHEVSKNKDKYELANIQTVEKPSYNKLAIQERPKNHVWKVLK